MKPKYEIRKIRHGEYDLIFTIGVQSFTIKYGGNKKETLWMKRMLQSALNNLTTK